MEMEFEFVLFTARYAAMRDAYGVAVQTSVGEPKMSVDASRKDNFKQLAPYGINFGAPRETFEKRYRERLEKKDLTFYETVFLQIATRHDCGNLVLLCYEDITKPGKWCHRRMFAQWWEDQTGIHVPDIDSQGTLL
jgi:hypothetical protein